MLNCPKTGLFAATFLAAVALSPASPAGEREGHGGKERRGEQAGLVAV